MRRVDELMDRVREIRERVLREGGAEGGPGVREPQQLAWGLGPPAPRRPPPAAPRAVVRRRLQRGIRELEEFIAEVGGGRIEPPRVDGETLVVPLRARDDATYFLEIRTRNYPAEPPSCSFVTGDGRPRVEAWPAYEPSGPFRPPEFICSPPTAEFYEYHSERRYRPEDGTLVATVSMVYVALQAPAYRGRWNEQVRSRRAAGRRLRRNQPGAERPR